MTASKNERLHVMLSPAELRDLDNYRFASGLVTRSDAVRFLLKMALLVDPNSFGLPPQHAAALNLMKKVAKVVQDEEEQKKKPRVVDQDVNSKTA